MLNSSMSEKDSDPALIGRVVKKDEAAFDILYARYGNKIFHYIFGFFFDVNVAEDVASDFWATIWIQAHTFRGDASVKNWLYRIARNKTFDELRRTKNKKRQVEQEIEDEIISELPDNRCQPDDELGKKEESRLMQTALRKLSHDHREIVELFYYQELKYQEIEEILEIPLGTVKTRLLSAKGQLKRSLQQSEHFKGLIA